jgi:hydroxymethylglutaryl-CoA lyase
MSPSLPLVFEVGPRDGLQNEKMVLGLENKIWLCQSLREAGVAALEAGAFVRKDRVQQMADTDELAQHFDSSGLNSSFYYLVPNLKGLERAIQVGVKNIALFTAVSETFNQKNIGMSVDESFRVMETLVQEAKKHALRVRGYVSTVWGCPFEGRIPAQRAVSILERFLSLGVEQVSVGDTIGVASTAGVKEVLRAFPDSIRASRLAMHFHDTRGTALANVEASYELGIRTFDASLGGLGGCPFAPGASGNLATEDLVFFLKENGVSAGIDYQKLCQTSLELSRRMNQRPLSSRALQAYAANCHQQNAWDGSTSK